MKLASNGVAASEGAQILLKTLLISQMMTMSWCVPSPILSNNRTHWFCYLVPLYTENVP